MIKYLCLLSPVTYRNWRGYFLIIFGICGSNQAAPSNPWVVCVGKSKGGGRREAGSNSERKEQKTKPPKARGQVGGFKSIDQITVVGGRGKYSNASVKPGPTSLCKTRPDRNQFRRPEQNRPEVCPVNCPVNGGSSRNSPVEQVYNNQMINPHNGWFVLIIKRGDLLFLLGGILPLLGGEW